MQFKRWQIKESNLRITYSNIELSKLMLKSLLSSNNFNLTNKHYFYKIFHSYFKKAAIGSFTRSCLFTGHSRSIFKMFKLSRHQSKKMASNGYIVGLRKSSF